MKNKYDAEIKIAGEKGANIDGAMFGLFFEDINYAADGGIMAEMIENYSFEFFTSEAAYDYGWSTTGNGALFYVTDIAPMNKNNTHSALLTVGDTSDGIRNKAYDGIYMKKGRSANVSLYLNRRENYCGDVIVSVEKDGLTYGMTTLAESGGAVLSCVADGWHKYCGILTAVEDVEGGSFVIRLTEPGTVLIDMVSCVSDDAVAGRFRKDIIDTLSEMNPGFIRFPGGCAVEGGKFLNTAYRWKETVGPVEQRKLNRSRWQNGDSRYYCQSFNLGFYEYFILCEYIGAKALPVVNAGLACMVNPDPEAVPVYKDKSKTYLTASEDDLTEEFMEYINDALNLIDFANGTDFENNEWAALRKNMGHEESFGLELIGIGNEQWQRGFNQWHDRYFWFEHFIHKKAPEIKLISSAAWYHIGHPVHTAEYKYLRERLEENPNFTFAADEHYYETPNWFYGNMDYYDKYPRDVNVFLGEVSARWDKVPGDYTICTVENAIAEAAYFTMLERNADIVKMVSAAPLLCRMGGTKYSQWSPNLIWFDGESVFSTPSYYVQTMYGQNRGDYSYRSEVRSKNAKTEIFENASYDVKNEELIIKVVNISAEARRVRFEIDEGVPLKSDKGKVTTLSASDDKAYNTIEDPENVAPILSCESGFGREFERVLPANSFTIIRL